MICHEHAGGGHPCFPLSLLVTRISVLPEYSVGSIPSVAKPDFPLFWKISRMDILLDNGELWYVVYLRMRAGRCILQWMPI